MSVVGEKPVKKEKIRGKNDGRKRNKRTHAAGMRALPKKKKKKTSREREGQKMKFKTTAVVCARAYLVSILVESPAAG